jgi:hypothetical protein
MDLDRLRQQVCPWDHDAELADEAPRNLEGQREVQLVLQHV